MVNSANQPIGVCGVSTMLAIFSVIDLKVWPGAITRNSPVAGSIAGSLGFTSLVAIVDSTLCRRKFRRRHFEFLVHVQHFGQILRPRTRVLVGNYLVAALLGPEL